MKRHMILGMGAGQCGLPLLAQILGKQPGTRVSHEQLPLLPWSRDPAGPGIRERLQRILNATKEPFVGDVASFYLPYVEEAIRFDPEIHIICLKRPRDEIVARFCRLLDKRRRPVNHWAKEPAPGWFHDPFWTRIFPQYDTQDREEGIGRYWDEYYASAEDLAQRFPDNLHVYDTEILTTETGVDEVLSFAGIPPEDRVHMTGKPPTESTDPSPAPPGLRYPNPMDPRRCVILVPFTGSIQRECEEGLRELERRGYEVRRIGGYAAIDQGRNQIATDALRDGFEETLWIDSDVSFHPDSVQRIRSHPHAIICGVYPQKGRKALACHVMPGAPTMDFGRRGGLVEILYAGAGFLLVRREVYLAVQEKLKLPMCNERFGRPMIPFFHPMIRPIEEAHWYLAEDYAFCHRARQCGFRVYADTSIRLWHIGNYRYGWEDAGIERKRFGGFTLKFDRASQPRPASAPLPGGPNGQKPAAAHAAAQESPNFRGQVPVAATLDGQVPKSQGVQP
jgi:hypothetical protein